MPEPVAITVPNKLFLGFERVEVADGKPRPHIDLRPETALRHMMALGSSGSGKTVLCKALVEEFILHGIPVICIDPQGDLCSLALAADNPALLHEKGLDPAFAQLLKEKADVVVFTPASSKGIPLSADPMSIDIRGLKGPDAVRAITSIATMIVSLLGYKLDSDDGEGLVAVLDKALTDLQASKRFPRTLAQFAAYLAALDEQGIKPYTRYLDASKIMQACKKLARLDVGARRMLFHEGIPVNVDLLLGLPAVPLPKPGKPPKANDSEVAALPGKTRVSVIYLNTLTSQEDKEFFVAALCEQLYSWMLQNPSEKPQALFYIDEVAQFIPPVRKPACKDSLQVLFKQARKYGICCLMATQNPGDVDYKAMAQFGTWSLGRLTTLQDQKKVQPTVKSLDPTHTDEIMDELPALKPGEFLFISPDEYGGTRRLKTRWLYTRHETLDEDRIEKLTDTTTRDRFDPIVEALRGSEREASASGTNEADVSQEAAGDRRPAAVKAASSAKIADEEGPDDTDADEDAEQRKLADALASKPFMSAKDFADKADVSEAKARNLLKALVKAELARNYTEGRVNLYYAPQNGLRPDLGLTRKVNALVPNVAEGRALAIGESLRNSAFLGILGKNETVAGVSLEYKPLLKLDFQEKVTRAFIKRIFGGQYDEKLGSVFLHPLTMQVLAFTPNDGMRLTDNPGQYASDVRDFDGVTNFQEVPPGSLTIDERDLLKRQSDDAVKAAFKKRFDATPKNLEVVFVPVWRIRMNEQGSATQRVVTIDALVGKIIEW
ncbi:MAG: DUF853 family protein [Planctomycetes bacterium]|nr:DUF853 family protein [Planctomycetota bacterium]